MSRTVVIGGGVIGLSSAYYLARRGARVTVIERGEPGAACSAGNLGWVAPSLSEPIPAPGLTRKSVNWMLHRDSPLYIDPCFAIASAHWLWRFWRHCNARDFHRGLEAVATLHRRTLELYHELRADGVQFEMHRDGLLFLFLSNDALERSLAGFEAVRELRRGAPPPRPLDRDALLAAQPGVGAGVVGGIQLSDEAHVRPETVCAGLVHRLGELGAEILSVREVTSFVRVGQRVTAIETSSGIVQADAFVLAAGAWSASLARRLGFPLPVEAGKGYSVTISLPGFLPARPIYLHESRVGLTPFEGTLRMGGTMELSGINTEIIPRRVAAIRRAASRYLPGCEAGASHVEWAGLRPLTPDGLPVIGRAPGLENLFVATGHAMHGVALAPATGLAIAELVTGATSTFELDPFSPARFRR